MHTGRIFYDDSGRLIKDALWSVSLWAHTLLAAEPKSVYAALAADLRCERQARCCAKDSRHETGTGHRRIALDLFGGNILGNFVPVSEELLPIIPRPFSRQLAHSELTGYAVCNIVEIGTNNSDFRPRPDAQGRPGVPQLHYLDFTGDGGQSHHRWKFDGVSNLCPHCGQHAMVCEECGYINWPRCLECRELTLYRPDMPEYSHPRGIYMEYDRTKRFAPIVEESLWDGTDFFRVGEALFVSNRAKNWMEQNHTSSVHFEPALLNIEPV